MNNKRIKHNTVIQLIFLSIVVILANVLQFVMVCLEKGQMIRYESYNPTMCLWTATILSSSEFGISLVLTKG